MGGKTGAAALLALGAYDAEAEGEDPLALRPHQLQFHGEAPPPEALLRETWNDVITRRVYGQDHPPRWLLVLSFSRVLLIERGKWTHNRLLRFDLDEILGRREDATLKAAAALLHRDCLLPPDGQSLLDSLDDNSQKHAFAVSEDLKYALRAGMPALHVPAAVPGNAGQADTGHADRAGRQGRRSRDRGGVGRASGRYRNRRWRSVEAGSVAGDSNSPAGRSAPAREHKRDRATVVMIGCWRTSRPA